VFPRYLIEEIKRQEGRDLTRFDVEYDIPDHFLPEFPPAMYLNQRTDLGDVSQASSSRSKTTTSCSTAFSLRSRSKACVFW